MPDPYWDDVAKKAADERARIPTKDMFFLKKMHGSAGRCWRCGEHMAANGFCSCWRGDRRSVNGSKEQP